MSVDILISPASSSLSSVFPAELNPAESSSNARTSVRKQMCSIGVQTECQSTLIDVTLPLWALALPDSAHSTNFPFHDLTKEDLEFQRRFSKERSNPLSPTQPMEDLFGIPEQRTIDADEKGSRKVPFQLPKKPSFRGETESCHFLTGMEEYENSSFEELRIVDTILYPEEATVCTTGQLLPLSTSPFSPSASTSSSTPIIIKQTSSITAAGSKPFPLYSDAIQVVLRYLNPNELLTSIQVSKQWYRALQVAQSLEITTVAAPAKFARMPANSVIARHVARALTLREAIRESSNFVGLEFSLMSHLAKILPNLKLLDIQPIAEVYRYSLPAQLETITVTSDYKCNDLFNCIGKLAHVRELSMYLDSVAFFSDFTPLISLPKLEKLLVCSSQLYWLTDDHFIEMAKFVRQCSRLRELSSNHQDNDAARYTLAPKPEELTCPLMESGTLTSIDTVKFDVQTLQVLAHYPSIVKLRVSDVKLDDDEYPMLKKTLPNLTDLTCTRFYSMAPRNDSIFVTVCRYLPNLRRLHMNSWESTSEHLDESLSHLPHLTELEWHSGRLISSLAPLGKYNLSGRLVKLALKGINCAVSEVNDFILPLIRLEHLSLQGMTTTLIPKSLINQLQSLPNMKTCCVDLDEISISSSGSAIPAPDVPAFGALPIPPPFGIGFSPSEPLATFGGGSLLGPPTST